MISRVNNWFDCVIEREHEISTDKRKKLKTETEVHDNVIFRVVTLITECICKRVESFENANLG